MGESVCVLPEVLDEMGIPGMYYEKEIDTFNILAIVINYIIDSRWGKEVEPPEMD